jgi:hypothetical protein
MVGADHPQPVVGGKVNVKAALVFTKVRGVDVSVVSAEGGGHREPVDKIA